MFDDFETRRDVFQLLAGIFAEGQHGLVATRTFAFGFARLTAQVLELLKIALEMRPADLALVKGQHRIHAPAIRTDDPGDGFAQQILEPGFATLGVSLPNRSCPLLSAERRRKINRTERLQIIVNCHCMSEKSNMLCGNLV